MIELAFIVTALIFICDVVFEDGSVEDVATGNFFIEATEHRGTATRISLQIDFFADSEIPMMMTMMMMLLFLGMICD